MGIRMGATILKIVVKVNCQIYYCRLCFMAPLTCHIKTKYVTIEQKISHSQVII